MYTKQNALSFFSQSGTHSRAVWLMCLVHDSIASESGNLQVVKKVVVTEGKIKDYTDEIQQSYELGFTPYRLHKNVDGTFVTPIRYYDEKVYVLDDVATMEVGDWHLETDTISSKLVYFVKGALQGDRRPSGARGLNGDSGDKGPVRSRGTAEKRVVEGPEGPPGKIVKIGPVGSKGEIGAPGEKGDKGETGDVGQQGFIGPRGCTGPTGVQGVKGLRGFPGIQGPFGVQGPVGSTDELVNVVRKETMVSKVLLRMKAIVVNEVNVV